MKKLIGSLLVAALALFIAITPAFAGGNGGLVSKNIAYKANYDVIYDVMLPNSIMGKNVVEIIAEQQVWPCDNKGTEVRYEYRQYRYNQLVSELNAYNASKVSMSGEGEMGAIENLTGFLGFKPEQHIVQIAFASQSCQTVFTQEFNNETGELICAADTEFTCDPIYYYLDGRVIITVEPYLRVR